jgi:hypothetical protein
MSCGMMFTIVLYLKFVNRKFDFQKVGLEVVSLDVIPMSQQLVSRL